MTLRTHEEIVDGLMAGKFHPTREQILAALREAADAARREEREALREWAKQTSYRDVIALNQVLAWLDARSRPEESKP